MRSFPPIRLQRAAFSLVEVVIAIGVVGFAMLAIVGSLPVGIQSMQDSMTQQAKATITQQLRADLQQMPFETLQGSTSTYSLDELDGDQWYFTSQGMKTTETDENAQPFYTVTFSVQPASIQSEGASSPVVFNPSSARNVQATLVYPYNAPAANQKQLRITLFSAKQKNA